MKPYSPELFQNPNFSIQEKPIENNFLIVASLATIGKMLGDRHTFPLDEFNDLKDAVNKCANIEMDPTIFHEQVTTHISSFINNYYVRELNKHEKALDRERILKIDNCGEKVWSTIHKNLVPIFRSSLNAIEEDVKSNGADVKMVDPSNNGHGLKITDNGQGLTITEESDLLANAITTLFQDQVFPIVNEINKLLPDYDSSGESWRKIAGVAFIDTMDRETYKMKRSIYINDQHPSIRAIRRKITKLTNVLDDFFNDPYDLTKNTYISKIEPEITKDLPNFISNLIAKKNTELLEMTEPPKKIKERPIDREMIQAIEIDKNPHKQEVSKEIKDSESKELLSNDNLENLGKYKINIPWLSEESLLLEINKMEAFGGIAFVVDGIPDALRKYSIVSRDKLGEDNTFDQNIIQTSKRIAAGIMPWLNNNCTKTMTSKKKAPEKFKNISIWYTFDISPNSPRTYFTIKPIKEITDVSNLPEGTSPDTPTVIIMAETDKANQTDVLKVLTGQSHKTLKASGSGSV